VIMGKLKGGLAAYVAKHGRPQLKNMKTSAKKTKKTGKKK